MSHKSTITKSQLKKQILTEAIKAYNSAYPVDLCVSNDITDEEFNEALFELKKELKAKLVKAQTKHDAVNEVIMGIFIRHKEDANATKQRAT